MRTPASVEGAKEGFGVAVQIIPHPTPRWGGDLGVPRQRLHGLPGGRSRQVYRPGPACRLSSAGTLPVGPMKTLSSSGARQVADGGCDDDLRRGFIPGRLAAIIQGSTETTFMYWRCTSAASTSPAPVMLRACGLIADLVGLVGRFWWAPSTTAAEPGWLSRSAAGGSQPRVIRLQAVGSTGLG